MVHRYITDCAFLSVESLLSGPEVDSVYRTIIMHLSGSYSVTELFTTKKKNPLSSSCEDDMANGKQLPVPHPFDTNQR